MDGFLHERLQIHQLSDKESIREKTKEGGERSVKRLCRGRVGMGVSHRRWRMLREEPHPLYS